MDEYIVEITEDNLTLQVLPDSPVEVSIEPETIIEVVTVAEGLPGKPGEKGEPGTDGHTPQHRWIGTQLQFQNPDGTWGAAVNLQGAAGDGSGDMQTSRYDTDNDGVVNAADSVPWSGVTGKPEAYPPESHNHNYEPLNDKTQLLTTEKSTLVGAINELFTNVSNGKTQIASAITDKGVNASGSDTFSTLSTKIGQITTGLNTDDATMVAADLLSGKTGYSKGNKVTGTMPNHGGLILNASYLQDIAIPKGYHDGNGYVKEVVFKKANGSLGNISLSQSSGVQTFTIDFYPIMAIARIEYDYDGYSWWGHAYFSPSSFAAFNVTDRVSSASTLRISKNTGPNDSPPYQITVNYTIAGSPIMYGTANVTWTAWGI